MPNRILKHEKYKILVYDYNVMNKLQEIYKAEAEKMENNG